MPTALQSSLGAPRLTFKCLAVRVLLLLLTPASFANELDWRQTNQSAPGWAHAEGVVAVWGDYNRDGRMDVAFHRPGSDWRTVPLLFARGDGSWDAKNFAAPTWANAPGAVAVAGDFNADGRTDIAFHRPGSSWQTVPVLFARGDGSWDAKNFAAPTWAHTSGVVALAGDFNGDRRTDLALHRPGSNWQTVPVLLARGDGNWAASNFNAPTWAHAPGVVGLAGDFNGDRRTDLALHRPGSNWQTLPVLLARGDGSWDPKNFSAPTSTHAPNVVALAGDFNGDGRTDIALHRPGSNWQTVPVLLARGDGSWNARDFTAPTWAHAPGVVALAGDVNGDRRSDIVLHRPGSSWQTVPVLLAQGDRGWDARNIGAPTWAHAPGAVGLAGDYNNDGRTDVAFHRPASTWQTVPVLFAQVTQTSTQTEPQPEPVEPSPAPPPEPLVGVEPTNGSVCVGQIAGSSTVVNFSWRAANTLAHQALNEPFQLVVEHPVTPNCSNAPGLLLNQPNAAYGYTTQNGCYVVPTNTNVTAATLAPNTQYRWRVRRILPGGQFDAFTPDATFRTAGPPTGPINFIRPAANQTISLSDPVVGINFNAEWSISGCPATTFSYRLLKDNSVTSTGSGACMVVGDPNRCRVPIDVSPGSYRLEVTQNTQWGSVSGTVSFSVTD